MSHEDDGLVFVAEQFEEILLELATDLLVHRGEGFVHQQDVGVDRQGPGQAYPLPHSAGELVWVGVLEAGEVHLGDVLARGRLAFLAGHSSKFEPKRRVAEDSCPRHQREVLEHHGPVRAGTLYRAAVHEHFS